MRILVVEDERRLSEVLVQILREQGYLTDAVYNGRDGYDYAVSGQYDIIVLDLMLPGMNGFEVVRALRSDRVATPVLILTAKSDIPDKVRGLDSGADDYMTKPFSTEEFLARIRTLGRRTGEVEPEELTFGDLTLGLSSHELYSGDRSVRLSHKEYEVLKILIQNQRSVVSKDELISRVWGVDSEAEDNNVEAYVSFLRKKFHYLGSGVGITALRKVGYRLEAPEGRE